MTHQIPGIPQDPEPYTGLEPQRNDFRFALKGSQPLHHRGAPGPSVSLLVEPCILPYYMQQICIVYGALYVYVTLILLNVDFVKSACRFCKIHMDSTYLDYLVDFVKWFDFRRLTFFSYN